MSVGSQTTHAMTRANLAGAVDARLKLQEIAAKDLGGAPSDYTLGHERVYRRDNPSRGLSYTQAAERAIALGGKYDGHELPDDIHAMTKKSATALAGLGLMGVAKDTYPRDGDTYSFVAGFAEVEVDLETGSTRLVDYLAVADVGTAVNPRSLHGQILGGINLGIGHALQQKFVYDPQYGVALAKRFHHNKPLTILDIPPVMRTEVVGLADPETPIGARGVASRRSAPLWIRDERDCRRGGRRGVQARAGDRRHRADVSGMGRGCTIRSRPISELVGIG
jgi:CO/xanthine dehydrogenase Mo-binding subunit